VAGAYGATNKWEQHVAQGSVSVNYAAGGTSAPAIPTTHLVHGILMFLSMGFLMPLGAMCARFGKELFPAPGWFQKHRAIQVFAVLLAMGGFGLAVDFTASAHGKHFSGTHGKLGLAAFVLAMLQPLNAFIRPGKDGAHRPVWEIVHKGSGWIVPILAAANIL